MPSRNLFAIALIGAVSLLCWQSIEAARPKDEMMELYGLFVDAVEQVEANYVRPVSRRELLENALNGMLQELDPHSSFINTSEWKQFQRRIEGRFGGIGIQVESDPDAKRLKVISPMVDTPAYRAGVLAGDLILKIDDHSTEGVNIDRAIELLQGAPGTPVKLEVLHEGTGKIETLTMERAIIDVPSVFGDVRKPDGRWDYMIDKDKKIGYLRINNFIQNTASELRRALDQLKQEGMKGLILDLRDNPGGLLGAAVEVSDLFLDKGVIVSTKGRNTTTKTHEAEGEGTFDDFPMVVLVNQYSASASEIVSAALQDHGRAKVVGQRSYGKGSVQHIIELEDGTSVLKLTVATYWRPSGKNIHRFKDAKESDEWGVSPDKGLEVKYSPEEYVKWAIGRRERDAEIAGRDRDEVQVKDRKPKAEVKDEGEDKPDAEGEKKEKTPFADRQLTKALEVVGGEVEKAVASR